LFSSTSIAEREEGPEGIAGVIRCEAACPNLNMAQRRPEKSSDRLDLAGSAEHRAETGIRRERMLAEARHLPADLGETA
jgi:hypothetical protein